MTGRRADTEALYGVNTMVGLGVKIPIRPGFDLRPEARVPIPFLTVPGFGDPTSSLALVVGVTYTHGGG